MAGKMYMGSVLFGYNRIMSIRRTIYRIFRGNFCAITATIVVMAASPVTDIAVCSDQGSDPPPYTYIDHYTSKFRARLSSRGWLGSSYKDSLPVDPIGYLFPIDGTTDLVNLAGLWVGGIVDGDTLVSVTAMREFSIPVREQIAYAEFFNSDIPASNLFEQTRLTGGVTSIAKYNDTLTSVVDELPYDFFRRRPHHPLNIGVRQKSYSLDLAPFKNILLLDYTITNMGDRTINDACVGYYMEPHKFSKNDAFLYSKPLVGSFRETATAYAMDADGVTGGNQFIPAQDGIAVRLLTAYPPPQDTNFNWWLSYPVPDFGPRQRVSPGNPAFDFLTGRTGMPNGDRNKYYVMRHKEWDYDQLWTATIDSADPKWLLPPQFWADSISQGRNASLLLSTGPFTIAPGRSVRIVFALFGAELIHVDPANRQDLQAGNYEYFYDGLNFELLHSNSALAEQMAEDLIDPKAPPGGLHLLMMNGNKAVVNWDPWVFPEVSQYKLYVKEVSPSMLLTPVLVRPDADPMMPSQAYQVCDAAKLVDTIKNLQPGQLYFVSVADVVNGLRGSRSEPIVIGTENQAFDLSPVKPKRQFAHFYEDDTSVQISWEEGSADTRFYRIYKTSDSLLAANRFHPMVTDSVLGLNISPMECWRIEGSNQCFYIIHPYDSVSGDATAYFDHQPTENAWYWVSAVNQYGFESEFSSLIKSEKVTAPIKDVLFVVGTTPSSHDYVDKDSLLAYYARLGEGLNYDLYDWTDRVIFNPDCDGSICPDWRDFQDYRLILFEDYPATRIVRDEGKYTSLLTRLIDGGHTVAYFGSPSDGRTIDLSMAVNEIEYDSDGFIANFLGLQSLEIRPWPANYGQFNAVDSLAGFSGARPMVKGVPELDIDLNNNRMTGLVLDLFADNPCIPLVPAFIPRRTAEIVYLYKSAYPTSSELSGMTCGLLNKRQFADVYSFSFHLWSLEESDASSLIKYIMRRSPSQLIQNSPPPRSVANYFANNYPNPFNDRTVIEFSLPEAAVVDVEIFNILGRKVRTLLSGEPSAAGEHRIYWDGRSDSGNSVATGVYLYRLRTEDQSVTRKMVLIK